MATNEALLALAAGVLFIIAFLFALVAGMMYTGRNQLRWEPAQSRRYLYWERSIWIAGIILLTLGTTLFAEMLRTSSENIPSMLASAGFLFGAVLIVIAECYALDTQTWLHYLVRLSVAILLLSQAILGAAILQTGRMPQWIGWGTIIWNAGGFILPLRAKDPYYPAFHYIMPLVIGVTLLNLAN